MHKFFLILSVFYIVAFSSCINEKESNSSGSNENAGSETDIINDTVIIDCNYSFEEAIVGTNAPTRIIQQLVLINVRYYSTDGKIHEGQVLSNKRIANEIIELFDFMLLERFPVAKAIPIVNYDWNDNLSMLDNNTYSFCYRNTGYSKHAQGMAIDINPFFNPFRSKGDSVSHSNKPEGAKYDTTVNGTLYPSHPVVLKTKSLGFKWGRNFNRSNDDHHFEK
jgi:hypothetical protein